jgi:trans-aconitate methyltransferase
MPDTFSSASYWEARYRAHETSGAGSYGRLATYKAAVINSMIDANRIAHVADFGCGDGNLLSMLRLAAYTGLDVSPTVIERCSVRFPQFEFLPIARLAALRPADLTMSIDVIYHLVEDDVFGAYIDALFTHSTRLVLIYASNLDSNWSSPHVRHRRFSAYVARQFSDWRLRAHIPNPYPFDPDRPDETSFADFFLFARADTDCQLRLPGIPA